MRTARWWLVLLAIPVVVATLAVLAAVRDGGTAQEPAMTEPLDLATVSAGVAANYRYAEAHAGAFSVIPCYCGCEEFLDHRSLADCFLRVDGAGYESHAAGCGVCNGEAAMAATLLDSGMPGTAVAERITEQFGSTPGTSPDATQPRT